MIIAVDGNAGNLNDTSDPRQIAITVPSGIASGDVLIAVVTISNTVVIDTPAGWTLLASDTRTSMWIGVFVKTAAAGDAGSTVSFTSTAGAGTAQRFAAAMEGYRGGDGANVSAAITGVNSTTAATIAAPTVTVPSGGYLIEAAVIKGITPGAWTIPSGFTLRQETHSSSGSGDLSLSLADSAAGGSGGDTWTAGISNQRTAISIVLPQISVTAAPSSVSSSGWTLVGASTAVDAISDNDSSTHLDSSSNPSALAMEVTFAAIGKPAAGQPLYCDIDTDMTGGTSGTLVAKLYEGGGAGIGTLRSTAPTLTLSSGTGDVSHTVTAIFPATEIANVSDWNSNLIVHIEATAS